MCDNYLTLVFSSPLIPWVKLTRHIEYVGFLKKC